MTDMPEPKKRGRPPLSQKAMTPAQRKRRQRAKPHDKQSFTKERLCHHIISHEIPYFVTSHIVNGTTYKPEYRSFLEALGIFSDQSRKQFEEWFYCEKIAKRLRDKSPKENASAN